MSFSPPVTVARGTQTWGVDRGAAGQEDHPGGWKAALRRERMCVVTDLRGTLGKGTAC
jgi:hypothetical protein